MANKEEVASSNAITIQPKRGVWRTYDITDGLPAGVSRILQDRKGYVWLLGSPFSEGLFRYDGSEFITYNFLDKPIPKCYTLLLYKM